MKHCVSVKTTATKLINTYMIPFSFWFCSIVCHAVLHKVSLCELITVQVSHCPVSKAHSPVRERERLLVSECVNIVVFGSRFSSVSLCCLVWTNDSALNILYYLLLNTIIVPKEAFISNLWCVSLKPQSPGKSLDTEPQT